MEIVGEARSRYSRCQISACGSKDVGRDEDRVFRGIDILGNEGSYRGRMNRRTREYQVDT